MADWTKADLANAVLKHLGVLAVGQTASAEDATDTQEAVQSAYDRIRRKYPIDFEVSAIPDWAKIPLRDYVAYEIGPTFGVPKATLREDRMQAEKVIQEETAAELQNLPTRSEYF